MSTAGFGTGRSSVFWGEAAPSEHIAHFCESEEVFLKTLTTFVGEGLNAGEGTIVIATPAHRQALNEQLTKAGIGVPCAIRENRFISIDVDSALQRFMVNAWPDDQRFADMLEGLIHRASAHQRRVRAFGEMVALLWGRGQSGATVRLEYLWNQFCRSYSFPLLCSYPRTGLTRDPADSLAEICAAHSRIL